MTVELQHARVVISSRYTPLKLFYLFSHFCDVPIHESHFSATPVI
jgi:hypothetical protein